MGWVVVERTFLEARVEGAGEEARLTRQKRAGRLLGCAQGLGSTSRNGISH